MYKEKRCFWRKLFIIVALLFVPLFIVLKSTDTFAASLSTASFDLNYKTNNGDYNWRSGLLYGRNYGTSIVYGAARYYQWNTPSITFNGSYASIHFETNLVISTDDIQYIFGNWDNLDKIEITSCNISGSYRAPVSQSISTAVTEWDTWIDGTQWFNSTLTVYGDVVLSNVPSGNTGTITCNMGNTNYAFYVNNTDNPDLLYFEQNPMSIDFSNNINDALLKSQINQNTTIINQNNEYYSKEYEAESNISNQSSSDISDASNNVTTNLLGIIQSFITELGTLQATDCNLSMPFPQFMGGTTIVNICQGRDVLGNTVAIISSVALIMFYIPLAFVLIRLIYNEIRSWTNG